jgi:hypothetical protein
MAVMRKGESTPWSTDHAKWIFANRFFFARKAAARGVNLNLRVDVIGRFRMVKKKAKEVESAHVHGAPLKRTAERIKCVSSVDVLFVVPVRFCNPFLPIFNHVYLRNY